MLLTLNNNIRVGIFILRDKLAFELNYDTFGNGRSMEQMEYDVIEQLSEKGLIFYKTVWHYSSVGLHLVVIADELQAESDLFDLLHGVNVNKR